MVNIRREVILIFIIFSIAWPSEFEPAGQSPLTTDSSKVAEQSTQTDTAGEMARKLQDPLANISALVANNDILIGGASKTSYIFQLQPVKMFDFLKYGYSFVMKATIPIVGM